jgi:hypothetical protein
MFWHRRNLIVAGCRALGGTAAPPGLFGVTSTSAKGNVQNLECALPHSDGPKAINRIRLSKFRDSGGRTKPRAGMHRVKSGRGASALVLRIAEANSVAPNSINIPAA